MQVAQAALTGHIRPPAIGDSSRSAQPLNTTDGQGSEIDYAAAHAAAMTRIADMEAEMSALRKRETSSM